MICQKCGAPLPPGVSACPYCGAAAALNAVAPRPDEATAFSGRDDSVFAAPPEEATEFAGGAVAGVPAPDDAETEFAGAVPGDYGAARAQAPAKIPTPARQKKGRKPKKQKTAGKKVPVLHIVLIAVLVLLIVLVLAKPYILDFISAVATPNIALPPSKLMA